MIPGEVEELTPAWLSEALATDVRRVAVLDRHEGTTGRARLGLTYAAGAPASLPDTLFAKLPPSHPRQRAFVRKTGLGVSEARFYRDVGRLPVRLPRVHFADFDAEGRFLMLLEDLEASGCRFPRPRDPGVLAYSRSLMAEFARLHAAFWESPRLDGDLAWLVEDASGEWGRGGGLVARARELFAAEQPPEFAALCDLLVARGGALAAAWQRSGPRTLVHGDPHMGNLFLDGERMAFLDWAMVGCWPPVRDVSYFLCNSIPPELRRERERELLTCYREELLRLGAPAEDPEAIWFQHRLHAIYSWVSSVTTAAMGSRWQPAHIGQAGLRRTTAAIVELDSLGAAREALDGA